MKFHRSTATVKDETRTRVDALLGRGGIGEGLIGDRELSEQVYELITNSRTRVASANPPDPRDTVAARLAEQAAGTNYGMTEDEAIELVMMPLRRKRDDERARTANAQWMSTVKGRLPISEVRYGVRVGGVPVTEVLTWRPASMSVVRAIEALDAAIERGELIMQGTCDDATVARKY